MKTKEQLAEEYANKYFEHSHQDKAYLAGFKAAEPKWISVENGVNEHIRSGLLNHLETVWLTDGDKFVSLGCIVINEEVYHWAESNGFTYAENGCIVSECESEDLNVKMFMPLPKLPNYNKQ